MHIGVDPYTGSQNHHILPPHLLQHLHHQGVYHLNRIVNAQASTIWHQGWRATNNLAILEDLVEAWNIYLKTLRSTHIHILENLDELIWISTEHGKYTPKL